MVLADIWLKIFFDLKIKSLDGKNIELSEFKNKAVLVVNVASNCGFTKQYSDLQKLWEIYKEDGLIVLGIPSNQFGGQEPGTNDEIKKFCEVNFNINFPLTAITEVKGENAHPFYEWANSQSGKNPKWNFYKYLFNRSGELEESWSSITKPDSKKIINKIDKLI